MCTVVKTNLYFEISVRSDYFEVKPNTWSSFGVEDSNYLGYSMEFASSWQS